MNGYEKSISKYVSPSEKILWKGRPAKIRLSAVDLPSIISGVFMTLIGAFISVIALKNNKGNGKYVFFAFAALIAIIGIVRIVSLFIKKADRVKNDVYVITDKRILILKTGNDGDPVKKKSIALENAAEGNMIVGNEGIGSIAF